MNDCAPIKQRLILFANTINKTKSALCSEVGLSKSILGSSQLKSELGGEALSRILDTYPALNPIWLLQGKGNMLQDPTDEKEKTLIPNLSVIETDLYKELYFKEKEEISYLYEQIGVLKNTLTTFDKLISPLIDKLQQLDKTDSPDAHNQLALVIYELISQKNNYHEIYTETIQKLNQ